MCTGTQQFLAPLQESIVDKPPYISGTLQLPESYFSLFYKVTKDGHAARHINLANATPDELEQLSQACEPATFGKDHDNIIRDYLLEGTQSTGNIKAELYKLNVYGQGSFFKPHVDTPRGEKMFASLVIVFPTPHEAGSLLLRHRGHEWNFDSGEALAARATRQLAMWHSLAIEHEVAPVTLGHRITLTYNLYFDDGGPVSASDAVSAHINPPHPPNQRAFRETFAALLENPEFMAEGGALAFGLRHVYPIDKNIEHVYDVLKGSDAVVYQSARALGYEPVLYLYYEDREYNHQGMIIDKVIKFEFQDQAVMDVVYRAGGLYVTHGGNSGEMTESCYEYETPERMEWATPAMEFAVQKQAYAAYFGNDYGLGWAYGSVCLVVRIGKAGDRLAYPTVAELIKASRNRPNLDDY